MFLASALKRRPARRWWPLIAGCGLLPAGVLAQTAPLPPVLSPGVVDRPPHELPREFQPKAPEPALPRPAPEREEPAEQAITARLAAITFEGATLVDADTLRALAQSYLGRPFSTRDLAQLKKDVAEAYRARGYVLTQALTPPQDLKDGVLRVVVVEVKNGAVTVDNPGLVRPAIEQALARSLKPGEPVRQSDLEQLVLDFNDLANVQAALNLTPGTERGTTDTTVLLKPAPEDVQRVALDNYGSELTGEYTARARLQKSNLLGLGETFGVSATHTDEDQWSLGADFRTPIPFRNLYFEAEYYQSDYDITGQLEALDNSGDTRRVTLGLSSNLVNTRQTRVTARAGVELRRHEAFIAGVPESRDDLSQVFVEGSILYRPTPATALFGSLRALQGVSWFGASEAGDPMLSRALADPEALILRPTVVGAWAPYPGGSLRVVAYGQWADDVLPSSDLFSLGGYGNVRGFGSSIVAAERGMAGTLEFSHFLGSFAGFSVTPSVFLDGGKISSELPMLEGVSTDATSFGVGLEVIARLFRTGDTRLRLDYAEPLGHYEFIDASGRFYAALSQTF